MATESADTSAPATDSGAVGGAATDGRSEGSAPGSPAAHDVRGASATAAQDGRAADGNQAPSAAAVAKARAAARTKSRGGGGRARAGRAADFGPPGSQVPRLQQNNSVVLFLQHAPLQSQPHLHPAALQVGIDPALGQASMML